MSIVVVIPVFKHSGLVSEALLSVLTQTCIEKVAIVLVNDGCPFTETDAVCLSMSFVPDCRLVSVKQQNRGLSAARNTGISTALSFWPNFEALYLLDADNRLFPNFLERALQKLTSSPENVGWCYPDFDMFGFPWNAAAERRYRPIVHLEENICEAGSLIRRQVFESGVRFDESFKSGFEDWDFWLTALDNGFVGISLPNAGFHYRRRGNSMLTGSERMRSVLFDALKRKHANLYKVKATIMAEHNSLPRFAVITDGSTMAFTSDALMEVKDDIPTEQGRFDVLRMLLEDDRQQGPAYFVFGTDRSLMRLKQLKVIGAALWHGQNALDQHDFFCVMLRTDPNCVDDGLIFQLTQKDDILNAELLMVKASTLRDAINDVEQNWFRTLFSSDCGARHITMSVTARGTLARSDAMLTTRAVQAQLSPGKSALSVAAGEVHALKELRGAYSWAPVSWKARNAQVMTSSKPIPERLRNCGHLFSPIGRATARHIGFLLPLADFGGVERVIFNYARAWTQIDDKACCHLFIIGSGVVNIPPGFDAVFGSINFIVDQKLHNWTFDGGYLGSTVTASTSGDLTLVGLGLLAAMDIVVNAHVPDFHFLMGRLRELGIVTVLSGHLVERDDYNRPLGQLHLSLAYEHAYDVFAVISEHLRYWSIGQGIPAEKIVVVHNSVSYPIDEEKIDDLVDFKIANPRGARPLNVLYLGRLDRQKGLDRLNAVISATVGPEIKWRVVGRAVLGDDGALYPSIRDRLEPPVSAPADLSALYLWADVVVLLSRFEGVPLSILEAQRHGCVVVATDVGGVDEAVEDGRTGCLVKDQKNEGAIIRAATQQVFLLGADDTYRRKIATNAVVSAQERSWTDSLTPLLEAIDAAAVSAPKSQT